MPFVRGDSCYILEDNKQPMPAKVISRRGATYIVQLIGVCGAIQLPESQLFRTEEEAAASIRQSVIVRNDFG
ncbi:hypothetical protein LKD70_03820 [Ruminococcus sp. CLA-AA-H200]|uniref:Uncharacterized protein n=1 Tax=Ruminococcus turbiniformis TaxID=2881258 RepID=A0ABS8FU32_9FIRM|nr:hypothetical protein [Ruminococcus turbiniformis]MCC2253572.1 hypothetical protein [Ruminococcus turbiniformis]